jgi:uncharacterized tellurite resistance protein B-like protein
MSLLSRIFGKKTDDEPVLVELSAPPTGAQSPRIAPPAAAPAPPTPRTPELVPHPQQHARNDQRSTGRHAVVPSTDRDRRLAQDGDIRWFPPGHACKIQGRTITSGMIYCGESLPSIRNPNEPDPALIGPRLAIDARNPDATGESMTYWPSYFAISPSARAAYLDWLQAGRGPGVNIGYVFLFFYGIERRVLIDAPALPHAKAEVPALLAEVERLLGLYGDNDSFRRYANNFLTVAQILHFGVNVREIVPPMNASFEMPLAAKVGLGALIAQGEPIPPVWALSWLKTHPETKLRTPATRCMKEFNELFRFRYQAAFGSGMIVERNRAKLTVAYRPASATFPSEIRASNVDLPDVSKLVGPMRKLWEISDRATRDLEEYSRWVGKTEDRTSLTAITLLPNELLPRVTTPIVKEFREFLQSVLATQSIAVVPLADLLRFWPEAGPKPDKKAFGQIARMLETGGIGIEPDPRFTPGFQTDIDQIALLRQRSTASTASPEYASALALIQMGILVSSADGSISESEERALQALVGHEPGLIDADRLRLHAYLFLARARPPKLQHVKAKLEHISPAQREIVRQHLVGLVGADGQVSPGEIRLLERIYDMLGFDSTQIHAHVHTHATGRSPSQNAVKSGADASHAESALFDPELAMRIEHETAVVGNTLKEIFFDEEELPTTEEATSADFTDAPVGDGATINAPLDAQHHAVLLALSAKNTWTRNELDELVRNAGLRFVDSTVEEINGAGFEHGIDQLIEPDADEFFVNIDAATRLLNGH